MKRLGCRLCGAPVLHGNLYCSAKCGKRSTEQWKTAIARLESEGFVADPNTPNIYRKDGIAVTLERIMHVGMDTALLQHRQAAEVLGNRERVSRTVKSNR